MISTRISPRETAYRLRAENIPTPYKWSSSPLVSSKHVCFMVDLLAIRHPPLNRYAHEIAASNILYALPSS